MFEWIRCETNKDCKHFLSYWTKFSQILYDVVKSAGGSWNTVLYMSYATIQRHLAFEQML